MSKSMIIGVAAIATIAGAAGASFTVTQNASVSFAGIDFDGIVGSGIPNSNMEVAVNTAEGIEVGLSAIERFVGNLPTVGGDTYIAPIGATVAEPDLALWNYVLVADFGDRSLKDFDVQFDLDFDPTFGTADFVSVDVDALSPVDPSIYGDSQNLGFGFWQIFPFNAPQAFDPNAVGEYEFVYTVFEKDTANVLARVDIVVLVPTPGAVALFGLAGLAATRRRRG